MATMKLNQEAVVKSRCPDGKGKIEIGDTVCKGLFLEVRKSGGRTFYLRYTNRRGRQQQYRIGDATVISLAQARRQAHQLKTQILLGNDPVELKKTDRQTPTFAEFIDSQYLPHVKAYKRSSARSLSKVLAS